MQAASLTGKSSIDDLLDVVEAAMGGSAKAKVAAARGRLQDEMVYLVQDLRLVSNEDWNEMKADIPIGLRNRILKVLDSLVVVTEEYDVAVTATATTAARAARPASEDAVEKKNGTAISAGKAVGNQTRSGSPMRARGAPRARARGAARGLPPCGARGRGTAPQQRPSRPGSTGAPLARGKGLPTSVSARGSGGPPTGAAGGRGMRGRGRGRGARGGRGGGRGRGRGRGAPATVGGAHPAKESAANRPSSLTKEPGPAKKKATPVLAKQESETYMVVVGDVREGVEDLEQYDSDGSDMSFFEEMSDGEAAEREAVMAESETNAEAEPDVKSSPEQILVVNEEAAVPSGEGTRDIAKDKGDAPPQGLKALLSYSDLSELDIGKPDVRGPEAMLAFPSPSGMRGILRNSPNYKAVKAWEAEQAIEDEFLCEDDEDAAFFEDESDEDEDEGPRHVQWWPGL